MSAQDAAEKKKRRRRRKDEDVEAEGVLEADDVEAETDEDDDDSSAESLSQSKGRATPSRRKRQMEVSSGGGNALTRAPGAAADYFQGVLAELRKVHWPHREDVRRLTIIVVIVTTVFSIFLGGLSLLFTELFRVGLEDPIYLGVALVIFLVLGFGYLLRTNRQA